SRFKFAFVEVGHTVIRFYSIHQFVYWQRYFPCIPLCGSIRFGRAQYGYGNVFAMQFRYFFRWRDRQPQI
ncbi:MAG: hypothetical protein WCU80_07110, partial [Paludibacteraceae bacterium]